MAKRKAQKRSGSKKPSAPKQRKNSKPRNINKKSNHFLRDLLIAAAAAVSVVIVSAAYFHYRAQDSRSHRDIPRTQKSSPHKTAKHQERRKVPKKESLSRKIDEKRKKAMAAYEYAETPVSEAVPLMRDGRSVPKLVIIIDDVSNPAELRKILSIPLHITPSLFPPSVYSKSTVGMAASLDHYMVHLPLQASSHSKSAMPDTLKRGDSRAIMEKRVADLRRWFPDCVFVNNHTGSVFSSDYRAMHTLYGILKDKGFIFVDSRTSGRTQGRRVAKEYGDIYLHRDIFIDNVQKFGAIRKKLKEAVKTARKRGWAIAIGHPHPITLETLKNSLDILVDVKVVYMDELHI